VATGTAVLLNGLPLGAEIAARVVNCISLGEYEKLWLLGLALDEAGNVWGIEQVPEDWGQTGGSRKTAPGDPSCYGHESGK